MKLYTLFAFALSSSALVAQQTITVSTGVQNADQTWYSFQEGVVESRPIAEWDLAFEITGVTGSVLANTSKGIEVYKAPYALSQWAAIDTAGLSNWPAQHNSETNWSSGAFNQGLTSNPFDLGWGVYNVVSHNILGDSAFVIKLANGEFKKFRVDNYSSATDNFTFVWADLDGSNEQSNSLNRATYAGRNFGYVSLENNTVFGREPATNSWDLLFTRYTGFVTSPAPQMYPVVGVLQNRDIKVQQVDGVTPNFNDWSTGTFSSDINIIGYDWKSYNMQTFQYEYATDRVYFAKDREGNIWKLVFIAYGGGANGNMTFTQELMSATSVNEIQAPNSFVVFPNPVNDGQVQLVLDAPAAALDMLIMDVNGRVVLSQKLKANGGLGVHTLDVSGLAAGAYSILLQGEGLRAATRLLVQ